MMGTEELLASVLSGVDSLHGLGTSLSLPATWLPLGVTAVTEAVPQQHVDMQWA